MKEGHKFFEEKVITGDTGEEIILMNGLLAVNVYNDRTHLNIIPSRNYWLDLGEKSSTIRTAIGVRTGMNRFAAYCFRWPSLL